MSQNGFKLLKSIAVMAIGFSQVASAQPYESPQVAGQQMDKKLEEVSGLAVAHSRKHFFWAINDGGNSPSLLLLDDKGKFKNQLNLERLGNHDWEDLETFVLNGKNYIAVADIGDNFARRKVYYVHLIPEPKIFPNGDIGPIAQENIKTIAFQYEDGPRDAEALGIDLLNQRILLLTKRDAPPRMYSLPLEMNPQRFVYKAKHLTDVQQLGQISLDGGSLIQTLYAGLPTAMTVLPKSVQPKNMLADASLDVTQMTSLAVLTYGAVWFFDMDNNEPPALEEKYRIHLPQMPQAEAMAVDERGDITILSESRGSDIIKIKRLL